MPTFRHLTLCAVMLLVVTGCASLRPVVEDGVRFIPVELWTGADWDGTKQLRMTPVKTVGGKRESMYAPARKDPVMQNGYQTADCVKDTDCRDFRLY